MGTTIVIDPRFEGPPGSANGGYAAGIVASLFDAPAQSTLRAPPPLGVPLTLSREGDDAALRDGERLILQARPAAPQPLAHDAVSLADAEAAARRYAGFDSGHIFPHCFVCGPSRAAGDGLRIFAGPLATAAGVAAPWTPDASLADSRSRVEARFIWAALDCPSFFALEGAGRGLFALLGRMTAAILERPRAGEPLVAAAWPTTVEGRKRSAQSALFAQDGRLLAHADCLWVELDAPARPR